MREWLIVYRLEDEPDTADMVVFAANRIMAYDVFEDYVRANDWRVVEIYCTLI